MHKSISVNMKSQILVQISMLRAIAVHEKLSWVINSEVKIISFNESYCVL